MQFYTSAGSIQIEVSCHLNNDEIKIRDNKTLREIENMLCEDILSASLVRLGEEWFLVAYIRIPPELIFFEDDYLILPVHPVSGIHSDDGMATPL